METLLLCHLENTSPPAFRIEQPGGERTARVEVLSPVEYPVRGQRDSNLSRELRWYIEEFLDDPFPPAIDRAERVVEALRGWGETAFRALFGPHQAAALFEAATLQGYDKLQLQIRSDDPDILGWPWEVLRDPQESWIATTCGVTRCLYHIADSVLLPADLPQDRVNILLVTARTDSYGAPYRSIGRLLAGLIDKESLPARVHVLRPPTLERLREHLRQRSNYYHLIHFDGHDIYSDPMSELQGFAPGGHESRLVFEDDKGEPDPVPAGTLSAVLREHRIPAVLVRPCPSAADADGAVDPSASVAAALLKAGTRSVVVMSHALSVSAAAQFLPSFYHRLFESGRMADAVRAGRQAMLGKPGRVCARGQYDLLDWMVPVLYESNTERIGSFAPDSAAAPSAKVELPEGALYTETPCGFVGREASIMELERAMRQPAPAILIQGPAGVGKTTLVRGFVEWLATTGGIGEGCLWLSFQEARSAEYAFRELAKHVQDEQVEPATLGQRMEALAAKLRDRRYIVVWDRFEIAAGANGSAPVLSEMDRQWLRTFLKRLHGGRSKVIITSRDEEAWLGSERRMVALKGLAGEERWELCDAIIRNLKIRADREDKALKHLIDFLAGHPLMMRILLPLLGTQAPGDVLSALQGRLASLDPGAGDDLPHKLEATLAQVVDALPSDIRPLLLPLGLHERYVDGGMLEVLVQQVDNRLTRSRIDALLGMLGAAGLLCDVGQALFELHPALSDFLRARSMDPSLQQERDGWSRAFVDVMGYVAGALAPRELYEQQSVIHVYGASLFRALEEARRLGMDKDEVALTQVLGICALNMQNFAEAKVLYENLAKLHAALENPAAQTAALQQLGTIAIEQRDFEAAEAAYVKCLAVQERQGDESSAADTCNQLATVTGAQERWEASAQWLIRANKFLSRSNDTQGLRRNTLNLLRTYKRTLGAEQARIRAAWEDAGFGEFPAETDIEAS